jgi:hypothetical protein
MTRNQNAGDSNRVEILFSEETGDHRAGIEHVGRLYLGR